MNHNENSGKLERRKKDVMNEEVVSTWISYNNNNQAFYSQASWGRLEMKPDESTKKAQVQNKSEKEAENKGW
jgi:hypothetical protein